MNVKLSTRAKNDLVELEARVREEDPFTAERLMERILSGIDMLASHPHLGAPARDEKLAAAGVRALVRESHVIFYRPVGKSLRVMRVLRARRHWRNVY